MVKGEVGQKQPDFTGTQRGALEFSGESSFANPITLRLLCQQYQILQRLYESETPNLGADVVR